MRDQIESMMKTSWTLSLLGVQQTTRLLTTGQWDSPSVKKVVQDAKEGLSGPMKVALGSGEMAAKVATIGLMPFDACPFAGKEASPEAPATPEVQALGWGPIKNYLEWERMPVTPVNTTGWGPMKGES